MMEAVHLSTRMWKLTICMLRTDQACKMAQVPNSDESGNTQNLIFGYPKNPNKLNKALLHFPPNFCYIWWFFSKFCCTLCSKCGFRVAFPTIVNINVNLYLVWKVVENVHFYVNCSKQKKSRPDILIYEEVRKFPAILAKKITWIPMVTEPI